MKKQISKREGRKRKDGWKRQARCTTGSFGASQKKGRRKATHLFYYVNSAGKKSFLLCDYHETKSKEEKNKKNAGSKKKAHCRQSVRYRPWWKQGNIKMAVSKDNASCWVLKDHQKSTLVTLTNYFSSFEN